MRNTCQLFCVIVFCILYIMKFLPIVFVSFVSTGVFADVLWTDGVQFGVGVSATSGFNIFAGYYNNKFESYLLSHFGTRIDFASSDPLKSAIDSAIDSFMRDGVDVGDGVKIDNGKFDAWHTSFMLDYYPFAGMWRISGGYAWGSTDLISDIFGEIERAPDQRFYFYLAGDHYYYNGNDFGGVAKINWGYHGPYIGTGFDINLFCGFSLVLDAGVVFTNKTASLSLEIPHEQLYMYNKETGNWDVITIPALDEDIAKATDKANAKLSDFKFYPMLKIGFAYNF